MNSESTKVLSSFKAQAAAGAETNVKKTDMFRVPPQDLHFEPGFNERDYESPECKAQIESFAKAYQAAEFVPPLVVRIDPATGLKYVVEGHQRTLGARLAIERGADLTHLDCIPFRGNDIDRIIVQCRSERGLKLTPLGLSNNYLKLHRKGLSNAEIAERMDVSPNTVESMLTLATAPSDVRNMVKENTVSATVAIEAVRKYGDRAGQELAAKLVQARAQGKTKVKASAVKEWAPPRKVALEIYNSVDTVLQAVAHDDDLMKVINNGEETPPSALAGKKVEIDAAALVGLIRAYSNAAKSKAKREEGSESAESGEAGETAGEA